MSRWRWSVLWMGVACGPVAPTEACEAYVQCLEARDAARETSTDVDRFVEGGACWEGAEGAELCDRACENGLRFLREAEPTLPAACAP